MKKMYKIQKNEGSYLSFDVCDKSAGEPLCKGFILKEVDKNTKSEIGNDVACIIDFQNYVEKVPEDAMFKLLNTLISEVYYSNYKIAIVNMPKIEICPYLDAYHFKESKDKYSWILNVSKYHNIIVPSYISEIAKLPEIVNVAEMYTELSLNDEDDYLKGKNSYSQEMLSHHLLMTLEDLNIVLDDIDYFYLTTYIIKNYKC